MIDVVVIVQRKVLLFLCQNRCLTFYCLKFKSQRSLGTLQCAIDILHNLSWILFHFLHLSPLKYINVLIFRVHETFDFEDVLNLFYLNRI